MLVEKMKNCDNFFFWFYNDFFTFGFRIITLPISHQTLNRILGIFVANKRSNRIHGAVRFYQIAK